MADARLRTSPASRGVTLVELLVAAALSLVMMGAVASLFGMLGRSFKLSQATMNQSSLLRSAAWQLRQDLTGVTCPLTPWLAPEINAGYFEIVEGPDNDSTHALDPQGQPTSNLEADTDDILLFTTQSLGGDFVGRFDGKTIESPYAEVAWFCRPSAVQPVAGTTLYDLHRRQLLVVNYLGRPDDYPNNALSPSIDRAGCDISLRSGSIAGQGQVLLPNGLGDLTKRENRFMRGGYSFVLESGTTRSVAARPFPFSFPVVTDPTSQDVWCVIPEAALDGTRRSTEDHVLTNVIGFDVRVFDPSAVVSATDARIPGDPGYVAPAVPLPGDGMGAYVDLGWGGGAPLLRTDAYPPAGKTVFQPPGVAVTAPPRSVKLPLPTFDTWPRHYEFNGIDDDADGIVDEGVNGVAGPDAFPQDVPDAETSPPYPAPLRGLEVRIRCYEPTSRQVRQVTVRHHFPE